MYIVIGGIPYNDKRAFLGMKVIGKDMDLKVAELIAKDNYDECNSFVLIINTEIGKMISIHEDKEEDEEDGEFWFFH